MSVSNSEKDLILEKERHNDKKEKVSELNHYLV